MDEMQGTADDAQSAPLSAAESSAPPADTCVPGVEIPRDLGEPAPDSARFPIVGIGASAGGLAAFEAFFSAMPAHAQTSMAFVLVQHLSPDHKSILHDLVRGYSAMPVHQVEDGMEVRRGSVYVIPPNCNMAILNGALQLLEPDAPRGHRLPIDFFFRSLAQDQHERALCIVLSGTGSDGALGVRAVKGEGGMVMAQTPESTEYDGMPRSAIGTGVVDYVLPPAEMPARLEAYVAHAFGRGVRRAAVTAPTVVDTLKKICVVVRSQTGHDFSQYKQNTVVRRIERRMALHQIETSEQYLRHLQRTPTEVVALFRDLLIGVTSFFRDGEAFAALQREVIPRLFAGQPLGGVVRVWVCGCSTGEEAYSLAILLQEHVERTRQGFKVQVFATDVDKAAIEQARMGVFPASIAADVTPERLLRFFSKERDGEAYRIHKGIRDLLIFSEQDVIRDPPFSRVDLISCRNLLIYMDGNLQKKLIPLFHYALNAEGCLFLGTSETVGEFTSLFALLDGKCKLYARQEDPLAGSRLPPLGDLVPPLVKSAGPSRSAGQRGESGVKMSLREVTEQTLREHYAQACVLINGRGEMLHAYGRTGRYLEVAEGDTDVNVLRMAREGLRRDLAVAVHRAAAHGEPVCVPGLRVKTNGDFTTVDLAVRPAVSGPGGTAIADLFLVILDESRGVQDPCAGAPVGSPGGTLADATGRIASLEQMLRAKEEYLQATMEEMQTSNEELRSTNEELQSLNEELQSTNEELETSKEELQSINEELATVNAELQSKVAVLSRVQNDLNNLLAGTGVGTLFLDHQLRIARFTPAVTTVFNLIQSDIGRPVGHVVSNLANYETLERDVQAVLDSLVPREAEVRTREGAWFLQRIQPYRTLENVIEGAVVTYVDISDRKKAQEVLRVHEGREILRRNATRDHAEQAMENQLMEIASVYDHVPVGLALLDADMRFVRINRRLAEMHGIPVAAHIGKSVSEAVPDPDAPMRKVLSEVLHSGQAVSPLQMGGETPAPSGVGRPWSATWHPLKNHQEQIVGFSVMIQEST